MLGRILYAAAISSAEKTHRDGQGKADGWGTYDIVGTLCSRAAEGGRVARGLTGATWITDEGLLQQTAENRAELGGWGFVYSPVAAEVEKG